MTGQELIDEAVEVLEASDAIDHWQNDRQRIEAEELLDHLVGPDWTAEDDIPASAARRFRALISRRATGEPVPYIKGYAEFRRLRLIARRGVFVPRDSTEFLAEQAVRRLRPRRHPVHVDLATGSGPVALAVGNEVPGAEVHGADLATLPIRVARQNARRLGLTVHFHRGDLFGPLPGRLAGRVDVVTFHPPYVGRREVRTLPVEVRGRAAPPRRLCRRPQHEGRDRRHPGPDGPRRRSLRPMGAGARPALSDVRRGRYSAAVSGFPTSSSSASSSASRSVPTAGRMNSIVARDPSTDIAAPTRNAMWYPPSVADSFAPPSTLPTCAAAAIR